MREVRRRRRDPCAVAAVDPNDRKSISVALPPDKYTVHWVAVAADGHRTHADYSFRVK